MLSLFLALLFISCQGEHRLVWSIGEAIPECGGFDRCQFRIERAASDEPVFACLMDEFKTDGTLKSFVGGHTAPYEDTVDEYPVAQCDSYIALGYTVVPKRERDCTTADRDFTMTSDDVAGGWYCPSAGAGAPQLNRDDFLVLQITVPTNKSVGINLRIFPIGNNDGILVTGICGRNARTDPPFAMTPLPAATTTTATTSTTSTTTVRQTTATDAVTTTAAQTTIPTTEAPSESHGTAIVIIIILVILAVAGVAVFMFMRHRKKHAANNNGQVEMSQVYGDTDAFEQGNDASDFL